MCPPLRLAAIAVLLGAPGASAGVLADAGKDDGPDIRHGQAIYLRARGETRALQGALARVGDEDVPVSLVPCVNCHGRDGEGRSEGGVTPSIITWADLTKPYGHAGPLGRARPAYTAETLERAIRDGVDPAGSPLHVAMPRYRLSPSDMRDLVAFLQRLGTTPDPGVGDTSLRLGMLVPADGPLARGAEAMRDVVEAVFRDRNAGGGLFGRRLELEVLRLGPPGSPLPEALVHDVFALVGGVLPLRDDLLERLGESETPVVGPWTDEPIAGPLHRFVFHLFPGLREQALALVEFVAQDRARRDVLLLHPETPAGRDLAEAVAARAAALGIETTRDTYAPGRLDGFAAGPREPTDVLFLGSSDDLRALLNRIGSGSSQPRVLALGPLAGRSALDLPTGFRGRLVFAFPTTPLASQGAASLPFFSLLRAHNISEPASPSHVWGYAAARVLIEGLESTGRRLTRERFVAAIEGLAGIETGVTPKIVYGPGRRTGACGAHLAEVDPRRRDLVTIRDWMPINPCGG